MTGGNKLRSEITSQVVKHVKLDPLVASGTRVGCSSIAVFIDEVIDDLAKLFGVVEGVEGDLETISHTPRIDGILDGAASAAFFRCLTPIAESQEGDGCGNGFIGFDEVFPGLVQIIESQGIQAVVKAVFKHFGIELHGLLEVGEVLDALDESARLGGQGCF